MKLNLLSWMSADRECRDDGGDILTTTTRRCALEMVVKTIGMRFGTRGEY
ncbi:hypothetical protein SESBI_27796 [Sesbania bispinosa]|nr:hypothetical protein SESBI_27796 [Sesbania bispinosa]